MLPILGGLTGLAGLVVFITAIPISYAIEARSDPGKAGRKFGYTNIWAVALNIGVARDGETQALRRKLLKRLAVVAVLFVVLALVAAGGFPTTTTTTT